MKRIAVLDIGTQSILLLIAKKSGNDMTTLRQDVASVRLGENLTATQQISEAACQRAIGAIRNFQVEIEPYQVDKIVATGTRVFRAADNRSDVIDQIRDATGFSIEILSEEEEALWGYTGATGGNPKGKTRVLDIGGGSTEMTLGKGSRILDKFSMPVGAVTLTESCQTIKAMQSEIGKQLSKTLPHESAEGTKIIGIGGTITTLAAMQQNMTIYEPDKINGFILTTTQIKSWLERLDSMPVETRRSLPGLKPGRADIVVAGTAILMAVLESGRWQKITVSDRGLRHGIARREFGLEPETQNGHKIN